MPPPAALLQLAVRVSILRWYGKSPPWPGESARKSVELDTLGVLDELSWQFVCCIIYCPNGRLHWLTLQSSGDRGIMM